MAEALFKVIENFIKHTKGGSPIGPYSPTANNIFITLFHDDHDLPMNAAKKVEVYVKTNFIAQYMKTTSEDWDLEGNSLNEYTNVTDKQVSPKKRNQQPCPHPDEALKGLACLQLFSTGTLIPANMSVAWIAIHPEYPGYKKRKLMEWVEKAESMHHYGIYDCLEPRIKALIEATGGWGLWMRATYHQRLKVFYNHFDGAPYCISDKVFAGVKHGLDMEGIFGSKKDCSAEKRKIAEDMEFTMRYHFGEYCEYAFWCIWDGEDEKAKEVFTGSVSTINNNNINLTSRQISLDWVNLPVRPFLGYNYKTPTTPDAPRKPQTLKRARTTEENQRNAMSKRRARAMLN